MVPVDINVGNSTDNRRTDVRFYHSPQIDSNTLPSICYIRCFSRLWEIVNPVIVAYLGRITQITISIGSSGNVRP